MIYVEKLNIARSEQELTSFRKTNFINWSNARYHWLYRDNISGDAMCWAFKNEESGTVIGSTAIFPRSFRVDGDVVTAGITGDFGVKKKYRTLGPAIALQKATISSCDDGTFDFLYGVTNHLSAPVQKRAGFTIIGETVRLTKIFRSFKHIERKVKNKLLAKCLSIPIDFMIKLRTIFCLRYFSTSLTYESLDDFDTKFDDLWEKAKDKFPLIGERSRQFLNWRFRKSPSHDYLIFALKNRKYNSLIGYIVYYKQGSDARIVDILTLNNKKFLKVLIAYFIKYIQNSIYSSSSIVYFGNSYLIAEFKKIGFSERADKNKFVAYIPPLTLLQKKIISKEDWYFLEADNDA